MTNRGIFIAEDAEQFFKQNAGKPYRPANGTEGDFFYGAYCRDCIRERALRADPEGFGLGCPIAGRSFFICDVNDPAYPKEWIYGADGQPTCTAFEHDVGQEEARCDKTGDMFGDAK